MPVPFFAWSRALTSWTARTLESCVRIPLDECM